MTIDDGKQGDPSSTKYAFKQLPTFNPTYYRRWASDVQLAFGERRWMDFLVYPPDEKFKPDVHTLVRTKAFLSQAIPYEHGAGIEGCATAAEIFYSLQQHFGLAPREDDLRLEAQLMVLRKAGTDTIDQHITKVENLIAAIMAQQAPGKKYDNDKRNQLFLQTITHAKIEGEDWSGFVPYLGRSWHSMTPQAVFAEARIFYNSRVLPSKTTPANTSNTIEGNVYMTQGKNTNFNNRGQSNNRGGHSGHDGRGGKPNYNNSNKGNTSNNNSGNHNYGNKNNSNNNNQRSKYDPNQYCHFHGAAGHSTDSCRAKFKDEKYMQFQQSQQTPQRPQSDPPSQHRANRICDIQVLRTSTSKDIWVYDSCCTDSMTGIKDNFQSFEEFTEPIPVYGVGKALLHAYGQGDVILKDTLNNTTHTLQQVWCVPGIQESIISAFHTRSNSLKTTMDDNENFVITSRILGSHFTATTTYMNRMAIFTTIQALQPTSKALITTTGNSSTDSPDSSTSDSDFSRSSTSGSSNSSTFTTSTSTASDPPTTPTGSSSSQQKLKSWRNQKL